MHMFFTNLCLGLSLFLLFNVNLSSPSPSAVMKILKHQENLSTNRQLLPFLNPRGICSKYALNILMLSKLIIISIFLIHILIHCLSILINSVRFVPYNFNLNVSVKLLKNSQSISINSIFYILLLHIDSVESFIMSLYFLSDIYYIYVLTFVTSKIKSLASVKSIHNLGNKVTLIVLSSIILHFYSFCLSFASVSTVSNCTSTLIITCLFFALLQSTRIWLMFINTFINIDDMMNIMILTSQVVCMHRFLFIIIINSFLSRLYTITHWVISLKIVLSNDVDKNPGDFVNNFFTFCNWNLNSLAKDNFYRTWLLEAHNSFHNYDIIFICETSLNDSVELPDTLLNDYPFVSANNPSNAKHDGVGIFYENSLPVTQL